MKLKLSILVGALALAVAGQANASVVGSFTAQNSDLVLSVFDTTSSTAFVEDLGVNLTTFMSNVSGTATTLAAASPYAAGSTTVLGSTTDEAALASFISAAGTDSLTWNVSAANSNATKGFEVNKLLTTSNNGTAAFTALSNTTLINDNVGQTSYFGTASNQMGTTATSVSGSSYASLAVGSTPILSTLAPTSTSAVGSSMGLLFVTPSSTSITAKAVATTFGNAAGADTVTLASNGVLTYSVAGVAAVPEPGEWMLMLSGFGLVGFIAARRKNHNASMKFA